MEVELAVLYKSHTDKLLQLLIHCVNLSYVPAMSASPTGSRMNFFIQDLVFVSNFAGNRKTHPDTTLVNTTTRTTG